MSDSYYRYEIRQVKLYTYPVSRKVKPFIQSTSKQSIAVTLSKELLHHLTKLYNINIEDITKREAQEFIVELDGRPGILILL